MTDAVQNIFWENSDLTIEQAQSLTNEALNGMDDGELFLEYCQSENFVFDDGRLKNAGYDITQGFGLRSVLGETTGYSHTSSISKQALESAVPVVRSIRAGHNGVSQAMEAPNRANKILYVADNPLTAIDFNQKVQLLEKVDAYLRNKDPRVKQVSVSLSGEWQVVEIIRAGGHRCHDVRPLVRFNVSVVVEQNGRMERGSYGHGGRQGYSPFINEEQWTYAADEALRQGLVNLESIALKAGEMTVVLGAGWPGVLLHEAVGHGLEGDCNRKEVSVFSELMGKQVAANNVTIVDNGTLPDLRGSITVDDEGTPSGCTTLIEDGILTGYLQDRMNARLMGMNPTGNGRRESYECQPIPRMTNTYMLGGDASQKDMIASVENGLFAVSFGGGQVDTTSGKFVFSATEAYKIEKGKIVAPVKGATLIGDGASVLTHITAVGNDMALDKGIGTCGKDGQSVPVGVGQPSLLVSKMTVGGTET